MSVWPVKKLKTSARAAADALTDTVTETFGTLQSSALVTSKVAHSGNIEELQT